MAGTPPTKPWTNKAWRQFLLEIVEDVRALEINTALTQYGTTDSVGGSGGGGGYRSFPGEILVGPGNSPGAECGYLIQEKLGPGASAGDVEDSAPFLATNTYENGVQASGEADQLFVPPGVQTPYTHSAECFGFSTYTLKGLPGTNEGAIGATVTVHAKVCEETEAATCSSCPKTDRILGPNTFYWFSAPLVPCFDCSDNDGGEGLRSGLPVNPMDDTRTMTPKMDAGLRVPGKGDY